MGYIYPNPSGFVIQSTLTGAKRLLGNATEPALPLTPEDMVSIYRILDMTNIKDLKFWAALVLSYRCLLRVSHVTTSAHVMRVKDVEFNSEGMDVIVRSSKTIQFRQRTNRIPVVKSEASVLCPVSVLRRYLQVAQKPPGAVMFGYTYNEYSIKFKELCRAIGLVGKYTTHSVRRGSASFLASFLPLHDVKTYGDWRSWSVLLYLSDTYSSRVVKDKMVASHLQEFA